MALYTILNAQLAYGHVALLDHADFSLENGERVGLIGRNGTGKSSLLKVIAGMIPPDDGEQSRQQGLKCVYIEQEPQLNPDSTVFDEVMNGAGEGAELLKDYQHIMTQLEAPDCSEEQLSLLLLDLEKIQSQIEATNGWGLQSRVESILVQIGLDGRSYCRELSGGMVKKMALAQAILQNPDVLLLDEPTNHLDLSAIAWLEDLILGFKGSVLLITHDRAFLDRVTTRIIELDRGVLRSYPGNFQAYRLQKAKQLEDEKVEQAKFDKLLAQEEIWIRKGVEARRTKSVARIERLKDMRTQRVARRDVVGQVKMESAQADKSGKMVAELIAVTKKFDQKNIVDNFTCNIMRGDKIGLLAGNGMGKTTMIKLMLGELEPDTGSIRTGSNLQIAYFDQMRSQLDLDLTLAETISPGSEWVEINGSRKHVIGYLNDFLFSPQRAQSPVSSLSGGERNRLLMARLFAKPANILVLDEPTNDLDIETLELLEELLQDYDGTVILVSHDREFLDNVVTSVIAREPQEGKWREYIGGFYDWQRQSGLKVPIGAMQSLKSGKEVESPTLSTDAKANVNPSSDAKVSLKSKKKLSFNDQQELKNLPKKIELLESEQSDLQALIADGQIFGSDPEKALQSTQRLAQIEEDVLAALARWEELEGS